MKETSHFLFCYKVTCLAKQVVLHAIAIKIVKPSSFLGGAFEPLRRSLATVNEKLKSNWKDDVDIQKLSLNGGAKANSGVQAHQSLQHGAASVLCAAANPYVHKATQQVHARA